MSKRGFLSPPVPPAEEPLVSRLRSLLAALAAASSDPAKLAVGGLPQFLHALFHEERRVPLAAARQQFSDETVDLLLNSGVLRAERGMVHALFRLQTFDHLLFLADLYRYTRLSDYVLPIGAAGRFMARFALRQPAGEVLDMGCGTGIQSLLCASHARRVTATDVNPRALALTRLNARLNGIDNIETLHGSHFEPVRERTFDLILFNAPYILSPIKNRPHSHAGAGGDAYLYHLLAALNGKLNEGGFAQIVTNWIHREDEDWWAPLQAALAGRGLDVLVLCRASLPAPAYAEYWLKYEVDRKRQPLHYALAGMLWHSWYRRHGIERIGFGSLVLRRRSGVENWLRFETATISFGDSLSSQLLAIFHNQDRFMQGMAPGGLLSSRPETVNMEVRKNADGKSVHLVLTSGQVFPLKIRRITNHVLMYLDGRTTLETAIHQTALQAGLQADVIRQSVVEDMTHLARFGWIRLET